MNRIDVARLIVVVFFILFCLNRRKSARLMVENRPDPTQTKIGKETEFDNDNNYFARTMHSWILSLFIC